MSESIQHTFAWKPPALKFYEGLGPFWFVRVDDRRERKSHRTNVCLPQVFFLRFRYAVEAKAQKRIPRSNMPHRLI